MRFVSSAQPLRSAADATHAARRRDEVGTANFVAGFFVFYNFVQRVPKIKISRAVAKRRAEIMLLNAEKTGADLAVGGKAEAIAMAAERFTDRGDDSNFGVTVGE